MVASVGPTVRERPRKPVDERMTTARPLCIMVAMTRNLGTSAVDPTPSAATPPAAVRTSRPGWRDPRLWLGIAIVCFSVVLGARLLAGADDTVAVWAVADDLGAGAPLADAELVAEHVRFADPDALAGYHLADEPLPADLVALRDVGAGELLPRGAVGPAAETGLLHVPISVPPELVPPSVTTGSVVDVYLVTAGGSRTDGRPAMSEAAVVAAPPLSESFGTSGQRQLVVAVEEAAVEEYFRRLAEHAGATPTVVRRG